MNDSNEILSVLVEIRDLQREHLEEYRRVASKSVQLQEDSVGRQKQATDLYKRALAGGTVLVVILVALILYLIRFLF